MKTQDTIRTALSAAGIHVQDRRVIRSEEIGGLIFATWFDWSASDNDLVRYQAVILRADTMQVINDHLFYADGYDEERITKIEADRDRLWSDALLAAYRLACSSDYAEGTEAGDALRYWADLHLGEDAVDILDAAHGNL